MADSRVGGKPGVQRSPPVVDPAFGTEDGSEVVDQASVADDARRRFSVDEVMRMVEVGELLA